MTKKAKAARGRARYERNLRRQGKTVAQDMAEWSARVQAGIRAAKQCPHGFLFEI